MPKIHHLSLHIVAKIAAGEVIERPAYAVKELIENAIDAKADDIQIIIEHAGTKKIQVIDNGEGMEEKDLAICWNPHTTSKISEEDSLIGIRSFGFRGEALASLAAVSTLTIKSRTPNQPTGHEVVIQNGIFQTLRPTGMPEGTIVTAENMFAHIPARKKFLKSPQTEMRHIVEIVTQFAAAYPSIHFSLLHNKRMLLDAPKTKDIQTRLQTLVGEHAFQFFLPVKRTDAYIKISGVIAKPQLNTPTPSKQFFFINKRKVTDKLLSLAVKEAFGTMLEPTAYPQCILFLDMPYDVVDVNVHPRKEQVSFVNPQSIFQFVKETVLETLQENNITFQNLSWKRSGVGTTNTYAGKLLKKTILEKEKLRIDSATPLVQLHNVYIVTQAKNDILFIDQHAAHERILFEKIKNEFLQQKKKSLSMKLQKPATVHMSPAEKLLFEEHKTLFLQLGFALQKTNQHNNSTITFTHFPSLFQDRDPQEFISRLLEEIEQEKPMSAIDKTSEEMLAFLACRAAVKAGDRLERTHMEKLVKELEDTPNNATCPHGRPTSIAFGLHEINTLFKRT